jgi:hypothetical protein
MRYADHGFERGKTEAAAKAAERKVNDRKGQDAEREGGMGHGPDR